MYLQNSAHPLFWRYDIVFGWAAPIATRKNIDIEDTANEGLTNGEPVGTGL